jgi:hypothetical protein
MGMILLRIVTLNICPFEGNGFFEIFLVSRGSKQGFLGFFD